MDPNFKRVLWVGGLGHMGFCDLNRSFVVFPNWKKKKKPKYLKVKNL
jgi:hypothetical protein